MRPRETIGFEIKVLSNMIKRRIDEKINSIEGIEHVTGMQGWIIGYLYDHGAKREIFQRDLEKEFNIRRSTATGLLQLMEKNGLIIRESVEHDARLKRLKLTEKAARSHEAIFRTIIEVETHLCTGLSEEEIRAFLNTIKKIRKNVE